MAVTMTSSEEALLEDLETKLAHGEIAAVSIDSRSLREGELFVALRGDRFDGHDFVAGALGRGAWGALVERSALDKLRPTAGDDRKLRAVDNTLLSLQELSRRHRERFSLPLLAVTGSNGKTTTKEMLASILARRGPVLKNEGNLNNHIGVPLTLLRIGQQHRTAVIEMGMSGLGEIALLARLALPDVGVITNIGPAHLQFLGDTDTVARAKGELLAAMRPGGTAVLNADDRYYPMLRGMFRGRMLSFGIELQADVRATDIVQERDHTGFTIHAAGGTARVTVRTVGRHNIYNALAAAAAALAVDVPLEEIRAGLEAFRPVSMRTEIRELKGRTVIADCYNANPSSVAAALELLATIGGSATAAVLGDMLELGDAAAEAHREAGRIAARLRIGTLIVVGSHAGDYADGALGGGMTADRVLRAESTSQAALLLRGRTRAGDTVLVKGSRGMKMERILEEF